MSTKSKDGRPTTLQEPKNVNIYYFTDEELNFLIPRQILKNEADIFSNDMDFIMRSYVIQNVCPRLGIDPQKNQVIYNVNEKTIKVSPKVITPEIVTPRK